MSFTLDKIETLAEKLKELMWVHREKVTDFDYIECDYKDDGFLPSVDETWNVLHDRMSIGGKDKHYWFHKKIHTPSSSNEVYLKLVTWREDDWDATNPQCIVYLNGKIAQGGDIHHTDVLLEADKDYDVYVYLYTASQDAMLEFKGNIYTLDKKIEQIYYDLSVPVNCCKLYEKTSDSYTQILSKIDVAAAFLDLRQPYSEAFYRGIEKAVDYLAENLYDKDRSISDGCVSCIGHTHIDVAWLWTVRQTREKAQRSFSSVCRLMERYPEFKFMSSQPVLYKFIKEAEPELYEKIKKLAAEGRWEPEGGMWLEADCNLTSGESLVRQLLYGKRFMKEEFGVENKILWLPDVFGYSAALPQILRKSGIDKFVTAKIGWNDTNTLPYDTLIWEGIDGSQIFTTFITVREYHPNIIENDRDTTYVGLLKPDFVLGAWKRYRHKEFNDEVLFTFGWGDGGGGPTNDMLEQQRRLSVGLPGMPKTEIKTASETLKKAEENFKKNTELLKKQPKWVGELYLELHRGTYTSIAANKKNNRKCEFLYQNTEAVSISNYLFGLSEYPTEFLRNSWEKILLNQFHDILPGSSVEAVYKVCDEEYAQLIKDGKAMLYEKMTNIVNNTDSTDGVVVFNNNPFMCNGTYEYEDKVYTAHNVPAYGWKVVKPEIGGSSVAVSENKIENKFFKVVFDDKAEIVSIFDKENNREVVAENGKANQLQVFEDFPKYFDAWEINDYYQYKMWCADDVESIEVINEGARSGLKITRKYLSSVIVQKIYLYDETARIDFDTEIDWKEEHMLLKASFPVNVRATNATYDIQFGNVERPTHRNTSWDRAKFEVCGHKWADLSEDDYGVSILNDCKYGYSIEDNVMKLTLLKCATYPHINADKGIHKFVYSLYPHKGNFKDGGTVQAAYALNKPFEAIPNSKAVGTLPSEYSMINTSAENVVIDTIKLAEDGTGIIVRMYECYNRRCDFTFDIGFDFKKVYLCDLMENCTEEADTSEHSVKTHINNYEILTFKIVL